VPSTPLPSLVPAPLCRLMQRFACLKGCRTHYLGPLCRHPDSASLATPAFGSPMHFSLTEGAVTPPETSFKTSPRHFFQSRGPLTLPCPYRKDSPPRGRVLRIEPIRPPFLFMRIATEGFVTQKSSVSASPVWSLAPTPAESSFFLMEFS